MNLDELLTNDSNTTFMMSTQTTITTPTTATAANISTTKLINGVPAELYDTSWPIVIIYSILFVISAIGNTTVLISLLRNRRAKLRIHLMILNLTIADLIVTYIMIPMEIGWRITSEWIAGDIACRVLQAFRAFGPYLSSMILVCISLDRYFAVLHPLKVNDAHRRSKIMLCFAWLTSIVCSVPQTIVFHTGSPDDYPQFTQCVSFNTISMSQESIYSTWGIVVLYVIPLIIIISCYSRILWTIHRRSKCSKSDEECSKTMLEGNSKSRLNRASQLSCRPRTVTLRRSDIGQFEKARIRTLRMTIIIVLAFVWCWTPYCSMVLLFHFFKNQFEDLNKDLKDTLFMFAVSNSCVNPLVYGSYTMNFDKPFRACFARRKAKKNSACRSTDPKKEFDETNTSPQSHDSVETQQECVNYSS